MSRFHDPALLIPGRAQRHSLHLWACPDPGKFTVALQTETWVRGERRFFLHETLSSWEPGEIRSARDLWLAIGTLVDERGSTLF